MAYQEYEFSGIKYIIETIQNFNGEEYSTCIIYKDPAMTQVEFVAEDSSKEDLKIWAEDYIFENCESAFSKCDPMERCEPYIA